MQPARYDSSTAKKGYTYLMNTILSFEQMTFLWPGGTGLHNVSLQIAQGDFVLITGASGAGKSTLLRLAARLEEPSGGNVFLQGLPLGQMEIHQLRRTVGFIQQTPVVVEGSVRDNLLLAYRFKANEGLQVPDDDTLRGWLDRFLLSSVKLDCAAFALSVGQKQRLCIIRSMLCGPRVLLLDEPTSALDAESRKVVEQQMEVLNSEGVTLLLVSHSGYVPATRSYRRIEVCTGTVREVQADEALHCTQFCPNAADVAGVSGTGGSGGAVCSDLTAPEKKEGDAR
ncbi:ABC transporter ATP-binding protein [Oleidesulfovibrio sp.]|uniref:ABC transporter ATP-binding protein n=1 Tax=Oleidesulfovibrio sp. TaxID=2909707 RepID=UPI003A850A15